MRAKGFNLVNLTILIFLFVKNEGVPRRRHSVHQILSRDSVKPALIALIYPESANMKTQGTSTLPEINLYDYITPEIDSLGPPHDRKAYLLYHVLRTAEEREDIGPEAAKALDETKTILRQALRRRCVQWETCVRKCPQIIKLTIKCTLKCKERYDDYEVCERITCTKKKCGVTLPPSWLLLR